MLLLRARGRVSAPELAHRLEVSERTILRDIEALGSAGVPVYAERGRHGGFSLLPGFRADVSDLNDSEAGLLFAYLGLDTFSELGLSREVGSVLDKLAAGAPDRITGGRLREVVHVDRRAWFAAQPEAGHRPQDQHLPVLRQAASERRRVRIRYRSPRADAAVTRTLDPLGLVDNGGRWYLVAFKTGRPHTYRVSRIASVALLDAAARLPEGAVLSEVWQGVRERFESAKPDDVAITIRVDSAHEAKLRTALQVGLVDGTTLEPVARTDSAVDLRGSFRVGFAAVGTVLAFGGVAEVIHPPELRDRAIAAAQGALHRHRTGVAPAAINPPEVVTGADAAGTSGRRRTSGS
ncbi:helix-turn-helix transcriptional regulator [Dermacoccaceae bacterium W4C1]